MLHARYRQIMLPVLEQFDSTEGYAETLFHELVHLTGHKSRLNREGVGCRGSYAREELVAELGAHAHGRGRYPGQHSRHGRLC